ncbi:hypothetical protein [Frankia sp. CiP3]|uniref:hypothetical protein n=1 Tax=Frankia sp. CiP3 TaxID=2880971 RepID=UPI001EF72454|nr:hypothetical protein [Frankia sp. CiP3]
MPEDHDGNATDLFITTPSHLGPVWYGDGSKPPVTQPELPRTPVPKQRYRKLEDGSFEPITEASRTDAV